MALESAKTPVETLRAWIREHRIWWEVLPFTEIHERKLMQVGFEFHLYGRHPRSGTGPGCSECHALHNRLRLLASSVIPEDARASQYDVDPYHAAFYCGQEPAAFDVRLTLRIRHREGHFDPIDACEIRCSKEIQESMRALGSPQDHRGIRS